MSNSTYRMSELPQISLFCSQITSRRFYGETLGILETLLISKDVRSSMEVRLSLKHFMRIESLHVLQETAHRTIEQKLSVLEFLVKAFALIGDFESFLALRYEALLLREFESASHHWLQVKHTEWIDFAEHSLYHGFHSIAGKACSNALASLQKNNIVDFKRSESDPEEVIQKIVRLKDIALVSTGSSIVRAEAAGYLKKKTMGKSKQWDGVCDVKQCVASSLFRDSIRKRDSRMLQERQRLKISTGCPTRAEF